MAEKRTKKFSIKKAIVYFINTIILTVLLAYRTVIVSFCSFFGISFNFVNFRLSCYMEKYTDIPDIRIKLEEVCSQPKKTDERVKFCPDTGVVVITDIINNTHLFNADCHLMRSFLVKHFRMVIYNLRLNKGHLMAHEGDSFQLIFKEMSQALNFCAAVKAEHAKEISHFKIRMAVGTGPFKSHKTMDGYRLSGNNLKSICAMMNHNKGDSICIKHSALHCVESSQIKPYFCVH